MPHKCGFTKTLPWFWLTRYHLPGTKQIAIYRCSTEDNTFHFQAHSSTTRMIRVRTILLFERSEFLISTSKKKNCGRLCVCSTNLGFSEGYVLCTRYVWYQVRIMYQIRMYHTCRCTINSTAVSLFVYSLVGGGTHDTYVPPKKQLYRYLFIR